MRAVRGFTPLTPCVFNNQLVFFCRILRWWTVFRWSTLIWIDLRKYGNLNCVFTSLPFIHCYGDNGGLKSYKPTREGTDKPWELVMRRSFCRLSWTWTKILVSTEWEHLKPESVEGEKKSTKATLFMMPETQENNGVHPTRSGWWSAHEGWGL